MQNDKTYTLGEWLDEWLEVYKRPCVKPQTAEGYSQTFQRIQRIAPEVYEKNIAVICRRDLQTVLNTLQKAGYSKNVIEKARGTLRQAFLCANESRLIDCNPSIHLLVPQAPTKKVLPLSTEELRAVEAACENDPLGLGHLLIFLFSTGLRRGELMALKWEDYDSSVGRCGVIYIRKSKTPAGIRTVPLIEKAARIIEQQPRTSDGFIFHGSSGAPLTEIVLRRLCRRIAGAAQVRDFSPHVCRHTFVTQLCLRGVPAKAISQIIGHAQAGYVLDIYAHIEQQELCNAIYCLEDD